jgi:L-alanine-DL-glutamate epimerase-like enolase superfamily enzyme
MKVVKLEAIPVRIAYKHVEASSLIARGGVADVLVKVTTEDGIVGWGECTRAADVPGIESAVNAMAPLVVGRSAWDREIMQRELAVYAVLGLSADDRQLRLCGHRHGAVGRLR